MERDVTSLVWETNGKLAAQRVQCWRVETQLGRKTKSVSCCGSREGTVGNALHVIGLYGAGDKISLFLQDWELAKVALTCHMALDMLCQEVREAWWSGDATERPVVTA